ncbi:HAD-IA family hydrolase [Xenophilus arseniciresistens]|uniref:HAD-IA family hydrolase n=1 Tax=Xenophilus arseniciresistens TaxID=1283306 RepID=A0AAE3T126_9BURK|nr:HAD-IA family hydrolase [Xenophilus arseniciresistens]MDA7417561.1 HAD-IA family hydrolase [Xenophilus arseniciresistens]
MTSADPARVAQLLDVRRIQGISLDLDDTLWPIWPTIERAEAVLHGWLQAHAPRTAALVTDPQVLRELREATARERSDLAHDLAALRRESIRGALQRAGDDPALAEPAFEVFFAERQRVTLYEDALPALRWLSERYPLVAVSNGNADLERTGVARWFRIGFSAKSFGSGKPHAPIFRAAAASIGLLPRDMLHVGDDAGLDVAGALNAGMQAAWLVRDHRPWGEGPRPQLIVPNLQALCTALDGSA